MNWWEVVTLLAAVGSFYFGAIDYRDRRRYGGFLLRVHQQAAQIAEYFRVRVSYSSSIYPVLVAEEDVDLAFRAMAEDILEMNDGVWYCRPAILSKDGPRQPSLIPSSCPVRGCYSEADYQDPQTWKCRSGHEFPYRVPLRGM